MQAPRKVKNSSLSLQSNLTSEAISGKIPLNLLKYLRPYEPHDREGFILKVCKY